MYSISDLRLFALVASTGNISKAARLLDQQPAAASAAIKRLEERLDTRLFERSTRQMRLTAEGELFLDYCRDALALLDQGEALLGNTRGRIQGKLRVAAPADFGRNVLAPMLEAYLRKHPALTLVLQCSDQRSDLFREPIDVAFRYGSLDDASFVSQLLLANRRMVVASPAYLRERGTPRTPYELVRHACLTHSLTGGESNVWRFTGAEGEVVVRVRGTRVTDDGGLVREWAVAGCGIAYKSWLDARADIEAGRLVVLFDELQGESWPLHAVYPHRVSLSPAARGLLAHVMDQLGRQ